MKNNDNFNKFVEGYTKTAMNKLAEEVNGTIPVEIFQLMSDMFADGLMHGIMIGNDWERIYHQIKNKNVN